MWQTAVAILPELIAKLERFGELRLASSTKEKLLRISAATVDRLLQPERPASTNYDGVRTLSLALC